MMNSHSKRFAVAVAAFAFVAVACGGGDSDEGGASNKADWDKKHASTVKVVSDGIDRSVQALNAGQRPVVLSECAQLREDLVAAKKAVPVPDSTVDAALRKAFDDTTTA